MFPYATGGKRPALISACASEPITFPLSVLASLEQTQYEVVATAPFSPEGDQLGIFGCTFYGLSVSVSRGKRLARRRVACACVRLICGSWACANVHRRTCGGTGRVVASHEEWNKWSSVYGYRLMEEKNQLKAVGFDRVDRLFMTPTIARTRGTSFTD